MNRLHRMFILRAILLLVIALNVYSKLNKNNTYIIVKRVLHALRVV